MQKRVHNLALKIEFSSLTNTTLLTTSIAFPTPQNTTDNNDLTGEMPAQICTLVGGGLDLRYDTDKVTPGCN